MTHQNHQTNGASLEDCHTNFFALTDLCGIKWRKFVNGERPNASSDPQDDPILRSYSRCMQADILCVWRRVQSTKQENTDPNAYAFETSSTRVHPPLSLAAAKELWIFWYGEEPDLSELVDGELLRTSANQMMWAGTWERGLSYECRSLLFKALHNLMERFVLTKDIVRFGKWFVQPCTSNEHIFGRSSQHLSFSFTFFVHGDTVCASIDLREHPAVRPLRKEHLVEAAAAYTTVTNTQSQEENSLNSPGNNVSAGSQLEEDTRTKSPPKQRKVILAPFGGAATLTGNSYKATDPMAEKILEEWTSFFPMCNKDNSDVPPVVEIISGGHKMYYPSIYVLVTDLDDMEEMETLLLQKDAIGTTSSTEAAVLAALSTANPTDQLNRKQVAMDLKPPILTTTTSITSTVASIEKRIHNEHFKTLQYYDNSINSYTCNTTNTHAAPQAASEMPERAWQDCITNTLHVSYTCATTSSTSSTVVATKIENDVGNVGNVVAQMDNASSGVNNTNSNNSNMVDSKQLVQQQIQQQQQKQQQFWGFVDPTQKAPCICTKYQFSNKKSTTSSTGGSLISSLSTTLRMNSTMSLAMPKMHSHSSSSNNGSQYSGSHLLHHRQSTNSEKSISTRAPRVPFHKRQHYQRVDGISTSTAMDKNSNNASTNAKSGNSKSHTLFGETTNATFGTFYQTTADTIPKPRTLANTTTPHGTPHGGASTYSRNSIGDSMHVPSVGSPGTPAPSPHPNSTLSQPTSVPPAEQLLNMSPRQPTSVSNLQQPPTPIDHLLDKNTPAPTPTDQHDNKSITASPYVNPTPSVEPPPSAEGLHNCGGIGGPGSVSQPSSVGRSTPTIAQQQQQPLITVKKFDTQALTPLSTNNIKLEPGVVLPVNCNNRNGTANPSVTEEVHDFLKLYKTPALIVKDIDSFANENCLKLEGLYDFSSQDAWVNHHMQPKRFKPNEITKTCRTMRTKNLYDGHTHIKPLMPSPGSLYGSQLLSIDANQAFNNNDIDSMTNSNGGGLVGIASKNLTNGTDMDMSNSNNFFQGLDIKSEILSNMHSPCKESKSSVGGDLYTAEGLIPSLNDLQQIFDTSSNEDCNSVQIHTPPDSNNPSNGSAATNTIEDLKRSTAVSTVAAVTVPSSVGVVAIAALQNCNNSMSTNVNNSGANTIQAEDLTKMFPTPPSHEQHHPNSSPCPMDIQMTDLSVNTITSLPHLDTALGIIKIKQEFPDELGSPIDEPIEDWSYVYKPPQNAKFVGSSKYAPLTNLLQPIIVPSNCIYKPSWTKQQSRATVAAQAAVQQQIQQQQQHQHQRQQQQLQNQHQQLHELLSAAPRTPLQQPRTPINHMPSPMHSTVPQPLSSGGSSLLLNQLNCPQAALTNTPSGNVASMQQFMQRAGMSPISPAPGAAPFPRGSPMMQPQRHTPIHPPPPYEMAVASPATSTSSYLNKQYNSQEPPRTPQSVGMPTHAGGLHNATGNLATNTDMCFGSASNRDIPEVSSLLVNILLYDTALNVFRDHNFDSSTVCVCNADSQKIGNIRGADSGVYVPLPGNSFHPTSSSSVLPVLTGNNTNMRIMSAFGGNGGSALDSPASLPGAGSGHTGSNSSSCTTPASNPHITGYVDDDPVDCTCGFSAVVNRRLAFRAGLFYEDEFEITGIAEDSIRHKNQSFLSIFTNLSAALKPTTKQSNALVPANADKSIVQVDQLAHSIFDLLMDQCSIIQTSSSSIHRALRRHRRRLETENKLPQTTATVTNVLELLDANDIMSLALEQARIAFDSQRMDVNDFAHQHQLSLFHSANRKNSAIVNNISVHKWPYIPAGFSRSNKEIVRTMNSIQPMLQNAFHSKSRSAAGTKDATYTVSGPLTWRQFHRLAGRASGQCEPQPIPSVIVGHEKDWISIAPLAIHYWDKFLLEPYSYARDVVYLIVCPDDEYVSSKAKSYFKELSTTYEMCKLGRHTPIKGWDGMLTVSPQMAQDSFTTPLDEWLRTLEDTNLAEKIRVYANAFHNMISPYLNRIPGDKTLLNPPDNTNNSNPITRERISTSPSGNNVANMLGTSNAIESEKMHNSPKIENNSTAEQSTEQHNVMDAKTEQKPTIVLGDPLGMGETMEDINSPAIVLYVVEPFSYGMDSPQLERLACIVLLRCYHELLKTIPESVKANINIQIISLESILELGCSRNRKRFSDEIKALALNIFSQCRRHMVHAQAVKSLTGFGTAANMEVFLKSKDEKNRRPYKMYTPPYVLAPVHEKNDKADFSRTTSSMRSVNEQKYSVMYCNYCISEDQSWLLATVTDDRGELLEKMCINIEVPNRTRRRKAPARKIGLKKLMDFIMGVISQTVQPWRLVIGRIGRIGHSELKSWSYLLSKQNLQKASKQLKDLCKQCSLMYPPSILSACLVTLEPDSQLRVMPDQFTPDERFSQISMQNPLSTPQDVTCTHILVFPTSAVCLPFTRQFQNEPQVDLDNDFLNFEECEDENEGFATVLMGDLLNWGQNAEGRASNNGSPDRLEDNRSWQSAGGNFAQQQEIEEVGSINQQPLAVGYMVSTAPTGRMPKWFWAACPHLENVCPVFLKTALHLHVPNIQIADDILNSTNAHSSANDHALDSTLTADVLRYVLEGYNALSWLALDSNTHDRLSCLPINVQTLMDLYYLIAAIA